MNYWAPAESGIKIEYSSQVLKQLRGEGLLFGEWRGDALRITGSGRGEPIGIYSVRPRGEVFLTEEDLRRFSEAGAEIALVIAGPNAGFFAREPDGSIQSVRSYEEFQLGVARQPRSWVIAAGAAAALVLAASPLLPRPPAEALTVRRVEGKLEISWNPAAIGKESQLDILDGPRESLIPIRPELRSVVYAPIAPESDVRIFLLRDRTHAGREVALVLGNSTALKPGP